MCINVYALPPYRSINEWQFVKRDYNSTMIALNLFYFLRLISDTDLDRLVCERINVASILHVHML